MLSCIFNPNLVILAWRADELWGGQAQNEVIFDFQVKFDLESQSSIIPKNNRDLNQGLLHLCSKFGDSSLNEWWVIVRTSPWLIHTHKHTDTQTQATTIPKGQNWPRVKTPLRWCKCRKVVKNLVSCPIKLLQGSLLFFVASRSTLRWL